MIGEYFKFDGWDQQDTAAFTFYDCIVLKEFGPFKPGDEIRDIFIDYEAGIITVDDDNDETIYKGKLILTIE